jgi:hypothetical protein
MPGSKDAARHLNGRDNVERTDRGTREAADRRCIDGPANDQAGKLGVCSRCNEMRRSGGRLVANAIALTYLRSPEDLA